MKFASSVRVGVVCVVAGIAAGLFSATAARAQAFTPVDCVGVFDDTGMRVGGFTHTDGELVSLMFELDGIVVPLNVREAGLDFKSHGDGTIYFAASGCSGPALLRSLSTPLATHSAPGGGPVFYLEDTSAPSVASTASILFSDGTCYDSTETGPFRPALIYTTDVFPVYTPPLRLEAVACPYVPVAPLPSGAPAAVVVLLLLTGVGWLVRSARQSSGAAAS